VVVNGVSYLPYRQLFANGGINADFRDGTMTLTAVPRWRISTKSTETPRGHPEMQGTGINRSRQLRFLAALKKTGSVDIAAASAHLNLFDLEKARRSDQNFGLEWELAERASILTLKEEAWRRAIHGDAIPLVSEGKVVHDDNGLVVTVQRYSDALLVEILRMNRRKLFSKRFYWWRPISAYVVKRLVVACLIILLVVILIGLSVQWLRDHFTIAAIH
jgi:hypothetical protein